MPHKHTTASISQSYCVAAGGVNKLHMSRLWSQQSSGLRQNQNDGHEKHWWQTEKVGWIKKKRKWGRIRWGEKRRGNAFNHSLSSQQAGISHTDSRQAQLHWSHCSHHTIHCVLSAWKKELMFTCDLNLAGWMGSYFQLGWQPTSGNNGQLLADLVCICWRFCQMLLSWLTVFTKHGHPLI